jgi:3-methyladenine DNA glycosylase AlkC
MAELLKNMFFTPKFVEELSAALKRAHQPFDEIRFKELVFDKHWEKRELKERMRHISLCLGKLLPEKYEDALKILSKVSSQFSGFDSMVFPDFVEVYGLEQLHLSLKALEEFTVLCSSEFAIRPFLIKYPQAVLERMNQWAEHPNEKVRRLSCEGCRPRLPWAMRVPHLIKNPHPVIEILEKLKNDPSEAVRRSVANNLNDISKDNPELALNICEKWYGNNPQTDAIVKHALRGLLKKGNQSALSLFGYEDEDTDKVRIENLSLSKNSPKIGEEVSFSFILSVDKKLPVKLRLEYAVYFQKAKGSLSKKVFKISEGTFDKKSVSFQRKLSFADFSTRKHYPGEHQISVIVNGIEKAKTTFYLLDTGVRNQ